MGEKLTRKLKIVLCRLLFPSVMSHYKVVEQISESRLKYLRYLIYLCYLYESRKAKFYDKFRESITLEGLRENNIVNFTCAPDHIAKYITDHNALSSNANVDYNPAKIEEEELIRRISDALSPEDRAIICLLAHGFTSQELSVIFKMKHYQSINVKIHRIRKKVCGKKL